LAIGFSCVPGSKRGEEERRRGQEKRAVGEERRGI